ncbi:tryptophan decarboxylase 2-like [Cryptomeria japonica]|uniref:tryptophan decarboxylase 2-like n=1 Tax=Cryptomeria japonica TaxID=3369 RepID=UPI0027DA3437|nr:tryptophan decarboxylase 2-like [Cryptomeria japonica]
MILALTHWFAIVNLDWMTSLVATELETIVYDWFGKIVNLPDSFLSSSGGGGVIQGSESEAVLVSLLAARNKTLKKFGVDSVDKLVVYIAGTCENNVRVIATSCSTNYGLSTKNVRACLLKDISVGLHPTFLCARDSKALVEALSMKLEYFKNKGSGEGLNKGADTR